MKVSVSRTINCAHQLPGMTLHGHTYRITAIVDALVDGNTGYVCTFEDLHEAISHICSALNHSRLETLIGSPATAERLAIHIARAASKHMNRIVNVRVAVGDDGMVETTLYDSDGDYINR